MSRIGRNATLAYGATCYAIFFGTFLSACTQSGAGVMRARNARHVK